MMNFPKMFMVGLDRKIQVFYLLLNKAMYFIVKNQNTTKTL